MPQMPDLWPPVEDEDEQQKAVQLGARLIIDAERLSFETLYRLVSGGYWELQPHERMAILMAAIGRMAAELLLTPGMEMVRPDVALFARLEQIDAQEALKTMKDYMAHIEGYARSRGALRAASNGNGLGY